MLGFLFGLNARLGRVKYFLCTIAVASAMTGICFVVASYMFQGAPDRLQMTIAMHSAPVKAAAIFFLAVTFMLQSMRFRDIGWDPVCVVPCWIALLIIDHLVASKIPAWSLGPDCAETFLGALLNFGLFLTLTFWPGCGGNDGTASTAFETMHSIGTGTSGRANIDPVASARIARASEGRVVRWTA